MTTETAANWGQLIEGLVALITIGGSMIAIFFNLKSKIDRLTEKFDSLSCDKHTAKIQQIELIQSEQSVKLNEFTPQISDLIEKLNELVTQVALSNQSVNHLIKQVDKTIESIGNFEKRLSRLEGKNAKD